MRVYSASNFNLSQNFTLFISLFLLGLTINDLKAEQFVLFDKVFTYEQKDAVPTKSHLRVELNELSKETPKDWISPVNYAEGTVYIRCEVIDKAKGDEKTHWSLCYIGNKGQNGSSYAVATSPHYTKTGIFEEVRDMNKLWQRDKVVWSKGIKMMTLVIKASNNKSGTKGQAHAHKQPDMSKFFPTKIRVTMIQVSKGSKFDKSKVPELKK